ncbi:MAG: glycosyltransferase [Promethearchaeota archaeon]
MNILIIYPHGNALNPHSGAETRIWNLNSILINYNVNLSIFHSIESKNKEDIRLKKKCTIYYYKELSFFGIPDWYLTDLNPFYILKLWKILRKNKFDIIQLEFPWGFLITKLLVGNKSFLIYDSQGVEREFMEIAIKNPKFPKFLKPFAKFYAKIYENLVCKFSNLIVCVSRKDRFDYIKNYKITPKKIVIIQTPSGIKNELSKRSGKFKKEWRKKLGLPQDKILIIFHGGLPHPANQEAFDLIKKKIAPLIKDDKIIFIFAGYNVKKFQKRNIISLGFVKDLKGLLYAIDFAIVPIISGSGMRIKCTDYIIMGIPFISTKKGIEGIDFLEPNKDFLMFRGVGNKFINAIKTLAYDLNLRNTLEKNLIAKSQIINKDKFGNLFINLYKKIMKEEIN